MSARHDRSVELLQELIRQRAVTDGTPSSGQETRSVEVVRRALEGSGLRHEIVEPAPGRGNLVGRVAPAPVPVHGPRYAP